MYLHAERFKTHEEAEERYIGISNAMRDNPSLDCAIFNLGVGGNTPADCEDHVVAIVAEKEIPFKVLQVSVAGDPYQLDYRMWQSLILHHFHSRSVVTEPGWTRFNFGDEVVELNRDGTVDGKTVRELYEHTDREHTP